MSSKKNNPFDTSKDFKKKQGTGQANPGPGTKPQPKAVLYQKVNINMDQTLKKTIDKYMIDHKETVKGLNMSRLVDLAINEYMKKHPIK